MEHVKVKALFFLLLSKMLHFPGSLFFSLPQMAPYSKRLSLFSGLLTISLTSLLLQCPRTGLEIFSIYTVTLFQSLDSLIQHPLLSI